MAGRRVDRRSRPSVHITNIYVNNTYNNVTINNNVLRRNVNYTSIDRYNSIHLNMDLQQSGPQ